MSSYTIEEYQRIGGGNSQTSDQLGPDHIESLNTSCGPAVEKPMSYDNSSWAGIPENETDPFAFLFDYITANQSSDDAVREWIADF